MIRETFFVISITVSLLVVLAACIYLTIRSKKGIREELSKLQVLIAADFVAVLFMFLPIYYFDYFEKEYIHIFSPLLIAIHNSIRVFILDGEFDIIRDAVENLSIGSKIYFSIIGAILYLVSPLLTFGAVLSLFKNVFAKFKIFIGKKKDTFVFSDLSERSLAIANSIHEMYSGAGNAKKKRIIFANTSEQFCEDNHEFKTEADKIKAICVETIISDLNFSDNGSRLEFFIISDNESANLSESLKVSEKYGDRKNTKVFVFSKSEAVGVALDSIEKKSFYDKANDSKAIAERDVDFSKLFTLRRVDEMQIFAWNTINELEIFDKYRTTIPAINPDPDPGKEAEPFEDKVISALILGFGHHGKSLLKTLIWYCQVNGYFLEANVVEKSKGSEGSVASFLHECPGIMAVNNNHDYDGDARYSIKFLEGTDITRGGLDWSAHFSVDPSAEDYADKLDTLTRLERTSIVFTTLGNDELNISTALEIRRLMDKLITQKIMRKQPEVTDIKAAYMAECKWPYIYAVVYDDMTTEALNKIGGLKHFKTEQDKTMYDIQIIGNMGTLYSYKNIFDEALEKEAFVNHIAWADIEGTTEKANRYYTFEYSVNSTKAQAIHKKMALSKGFISGDDSSLSKNEDELTVDEKRRRDLDAKTEHRRWCAYLRTVGYEYTGSDKASSRNDRAKAHHLLVTYDKLSKKDIDKDIKHIVKP